MLPQGNHNPHDLPRINPIDRGDFLGFLERIPEQVRNGWRLACEFEQPPPTEPTASITICGMGGSPISGEVCCAIIGRRSQGPGPTVFLSTEGWESTPAERPGAVALPAPTDARPRRRPSVPAVGGRHVG